MHTRSRPASGADIERSEQASSVELRVHGIGDHSAWSALGSPGIALERGAREPTIALPPPTSAHQLRLLSWNRTSRHSTGWLWYLALPFTMANTAAEMGPSAGDHRGLAAVRTAAVWAAALALTFLVTLWLIAIGETVARFLALGAEPLVGQVVAVVVAMALLGVVLSRRLRTGSEVPLRVALAHAAVIVLTAAVAAVVRPAHLQVTVSEGWHRLFTTVGPADVAAWDRSSSRQPYRGAVVNYLDPLMLGTALTFAVVFGFCAVLMVAALAQSRRAPGTAGASRVAASTLAGCATVLVAAVLVLVAAASALRLAVDNLLSYVVRSLAPGFCATSFGARGVLPFQSRRGVFDDWIIDLVPLLAAGALAVLVLSLHLVATRRRREARSAEQATPGAPVNRRRLKAVSWHAVLTDLDSSLTPAATIAGVVNLALIGPALVLYLRLPDDSLVLRLLTILAQAVSVAALVFLVVGRNSARIRPVLGSMADVLGFWPIHGHPLAGLSYRADVVAGIRRELERPRRGVTVLTGHSQGSVLAAWTLAQGPTIRSGQGVLLVTCGSPLQSLYATLFPAVFDTRFFEDVDAAARAGWYNTWRDTDPIATPIDELRGVPDRNIPLPDPEVDDHVDGHSDYWISPRQQGLIADAIAQAESGTPAVEVTV